MALSLTPETQELIEQRLQRGGYRSADELVRVALARLDEAEPAMIEDLDAPTQAAISEALDQSQRGEGRPWEQVRAGLLSRFQRGK